MPEFNESVYCRSFHIKDVAYVNPLNCFLPHLCFGYVESLRVVGERRVAFRLVFALGSVRQVYSFRVAKVN